METKRWYVQLSKPVAKHISTIPRVNERLDIIYPKGAARMVTLPQIGDKVYLLSEKYIIYKGKVTADYGTAYGLNLKVVNPIFIDKYYRRNWTVRRDCYTVTTTRLRL
jgi:hypothetical protein